ncbi:energy transducer TonB [Dolichospermum circinale CS-534/05]|uniref:energy transducer TonB n=1 Tax=Dolichospermum circinale TaxID=109265 RepID=UPI00232E4D1B|nr:energy transducer TonB [Dolichospermum circinale]MDB9456715.1 energy transducer TonB [Dolichospermum circinale CS-541/06]MDB9462217.1 energy transducer TonB [Dolichospermum circinale CS-541/04]MDB9489108.1 energy transducer TonB [Dolichospermum circinale CS-534/05]MDB9548032.1 energy transducer TonB [Dolichospermum circinale CS-1031]
MGLSGFIIEQREKEAEALKTFLFYSLIVSVALHLGVLALSIHKFFHRVKEIREEPIELTILEPIPQKFVQPATEIKSPVKINSGSSGGGNNSEEISIPIEKGSSLINSFVPPLAKHYQPKITNHFITKPSQTVTNFQPKIIAKLPKSNPIKNTNFQPETIEKPAKIDPIENTNFQPKIIEKPVKIDPIENTNFQPETILKLPEINPIQKLDENSNNFPSTEPQADTKPTDIPPLNSENPTNISPYNIPIPSTNPNVFTQLPQNGNGLGTGTGNGAGNGIGNGSGNGLGTDNGTGNSAEAESNPISTPLKPAIENSSKLNRKAECIWCEYKYPDRARKRGAEGTALIAIDTDENGTVTQVRLIRSSGDSELDEAAEKYAQDWKLTPKEGGREAVTTEVNFIIKGSQLYRKRQERQRQKPLMF